MFMSLKCVLVKSGACSRIASRTNVVVTGVQDVHTASLLDVSGCFEALNEQ